MTEAKLIRRWAVYSKLRWGGVAIFIAALPLPFAVAYTAFHTDGRWLWILPSVGTLGLALGSFGAANDTAMHAAAELSRRGQLPASAAPELRHEATVRGARLSSVHDSPKAAWVLPVVSMALGGWLVMRMLSAWSAG